MTIQRGEVKPIDSYKEHHFQQVEDVGVAWCYNRVWVCLNGVSLFRAKVMNEKLFVEFTPPEQELNK